MFFRFRPNPLALALCCAFSTPAFAADTLLKPVEVQAQRDTATLGLDIPSQGGSRTGVSAKELPASIEVLDSGTIAERGDTRMNDATTRMTGITQSADPGSGGISYSSRGFTGNGSVGIAEDGVRLPTAAGVQTYPNTTWGYERIEVLRGPASIVSGTGTVGATINAVRKAPERTASQEIMGGIGSDGDKEVGFGSTGALGEIASYRVDVYAHDDDGIRDMGDSKSHKIMSALRLQPTSALRFDFTADYSKAEPERYFGTPVNARNKVVKSLRDENYNVKDSNIDYEDTRLKARAEWRSNDWLTLSNEVHHFDSKRHWKNAEDYLLHTDGQVELGGYYAARQHLKQTGNRLEALLHGAGHRAAIGWEYSKTDFRNVRSSYGYPDDPPRVNANDPVHGRWADGGFAPKIPWAKNELSLNAFYAEDAWKFHERWQLMAGVRHDKAEMTYDDLRKGQRLFSDEELSGTAWRLGLTHFLTQDTSLYAQISKGHDPIASLASVSTLDNAKRKLTRARQEEIGIKQTLGEGLGEWTAALFHIKKEDILTRSATDPTIYDQNGGQSSKGIELSAVIRPTRNWRFDGNITRISAEYDDLYEKMGKVSVSRDGNRPTNVPKITANLWGHYLIGNWQASLGMRHVGDRYGDMANTVKMPSYTVADASVAWRFDPKTTFRLLVNNLTDKVYANTWYNSQFLLGEERRVRLIADMKF